MSASFRPVKETWGESSDEFISVAALGDLLCGIAEEIGSLYGLNEYNDVQVVWIDHGKSFLEYIRDEKQFNLVNCRELVPDEDENGLQNLITNMRALADSWANSIDDADGSLRFYID
jgi:hypothetical protein